MIERTPDSPLNTAAATPAMWVPSSARNSCEFCLQKCAKKWQLIHTDLLVFTDTLLCTTTSPSKMTKSSWRKATITWCQRSARTVGSKAPVCATAQLACFLATTSRLLSTSCTCSVYRNWFVPKWCGKHEENSLEWFAFWHWPMETVPKPPKGVLGIMISTTHSCAVTYLISSSDSPTRRATALCWGQVVSSICTSSTCSSKQRPRERCPALLWRPPQLWNLLTITSVSAARTVFQRLHRWPSRVITNLGLVLRHARQTWRRRRDVSQIHLRSQLPHHHRRNLKSLLPPHLRRFPLVLVILLLLLILSPVEQRDCLLLPLSRLSRPALWLRRSRRKPGVAARVTPTLIPPEVRAKPPWSASRNTQLLSQDWPARAKRLLPVLLHPRPLLRAAAVATAAYPSSSSHITVLPPVIQCRQHIPCCPRRPPSFLPIRWLVLRWTIFFQSVLFLSCRHIESATLKNLIVVTRKR